MRVLKLIVAMILVLVFTACSSTPTPTRTPLESPLISSLPTPTPTALLSISQSPIQTPIPPTFSPSVAKLTYDCKVLPLISNCGPTKLSFSGQLAIFDSKTNQLYILDLATRNAWQVPETVLKMEWSPSGNYLLVKDNQQEYTVYALDGTVVGHHSLTQLAWSTYDTLNFIPNAIVSNDGAHAWIEPPWDTALPKERFISIQLSPEDSKTIQWPIEVSDKIHQLIAWAPNTHVILAEYYYGSSGHWIIGGYLYSIDALTGKVINLNESMFLDGSYQWNPTEPGLMVFSATGSRNHPSERLALLNVVTGNLRYLLGDEIFALTPTWSPDGRLIAFSTVIPEPFQGHNEAFTFPAIYIIDPATSKLRAITKPESGTTDSSPHWSKDGKYLLYARDYTSQGFIEIRAVALDGTFDETIATNLSRPNPDCFFNDFKCFADRLAAYAP